EQAVQVHRLVEAVVQGLLHQRVLGDLAFAGQVLGAGDLVGEHGGEQVLALHALQLRGDLVAGDEARQRQRGGGVPAPAHAERGGVEQGLGEHVGGAGRVQVAADVLEREAVAGGERQDDGVFGGGGLQFEV